MSATILISTGARLHFGFFAHGGTDRELNAMNYGGVGLMIDAPGVVLAAWKSDAEKPEGSVAESWIESVECNLKNARTAEVDPFAGPPIEEWDRLTERVMSLLGLYRQNCSRKPGYNGCSIELWRAIPAHHGLGAGTQLGMAIARALSLLDGDDDVDPLTLAHRVGRGARSAIGIHGFGSGGFLVDAGKDREESIGQLESRVDVPGDWRFLLVIPPSRVAGLSGAAESEALSRLPGTSPAMTERLRDLALNEMLPALTNGSCDQFGEALFEFGQLVGDYFRPIQGGTYSTERASELVDWIRRQGFRGVAQTSWGPTLAVCCASQESAELLRDQLQAEPAWSECSTRIARPLNVGAKVQQISSSEAC